MAVFKPAGPGEILRAAQKDDSYLKKMSQEISRLGLDVFGAEKWIRFSPWSLCSCGLLYYLVTTGSRLQTLGEEYGGLLQVQRGRPHLPPRTNTIIHIFLQTFGPKLLEEFLVKLENKSLEPTCELDPLVREVVSSGALRSLCSLVCKFNLCLFYLEGVYYHLSKRLVGIAFARTGVAAASNDTTRPGFLLLGLFRLGHLALELAHKLLTAAPCPAPAPRPPVSALECTRCCLCLDTRGSRGPPSVTPCGHLFCWRCILEAVAADPSCPLCRHHVDPSRVLPLQNYN